MEGRCRQHIVLMSHFVLCYTADESHVVTKEGTSSKKCKVVIKITRKEVDSVSVDV